MKVALIQLQARADKQKNLERALDLVQEAVARKAEFILLPEIFAFRSRASLDYLQKHVAETLSGNILKRFSAAAKQWRVHILAGSIHEKIRNKSRLYNTSVLIDPKGKHKAVYRKKHLFEAFINGQHIKEAKIFKAGRKKAQARVKNFNVGLSICYDVRFPALYQKYKKAEAEVLCVPSAFTKRTGEAHWEALLRARAIENRCYVLAPNQSGSDGTIVAAYGHSMIISPWGEILAKAGTQKETMITASLSKEVLRKTKAALP